MDREAFRDAVLRYGLLFLISMALVAGFWFHAEFYALGLYPLLVVGGFATFLVIVAVRWLATGALPRLRPREAVSFSREEAQRILAGTQTLAVLPMATTLPPAGALANAVLATTGQVLARIRIRDIRRTLAWDVRDDDALAAGFDGADDFRRAWAGRGGWDPREILLLTTFKREVTP